MLKVLFFARTREELACSGLELALARHSIRPEYAAGTAVY